jgi:hypothetical protein
METSNNACKCDRLTNADQLKLSLDPKPNGSGREEEESQCQ